MGYRNRTYVIFDADIDMRAYRYMRGWKVQEHMDFDFHDAHDLGSEITDRASEETVKRAAGTFLVRETGSCTDWGVHKEFIPFRQVGLEVALDLDIPIIAVNLNGKRICDIERCPPIVRDECVVHFPFKAKAIKLALDTFRKNTPRDVLTTLDLTGMVRMYLKLGI